MVLHTTICSQIGGTQANRKTHRAYRMSVVRFRSPHPLNRKRLLPLFGSYGARHTRTRGKGVRGLISDERPETFLPSFTAIFKPTILIEPVFQPAISSHGYGSEETPLFVLGIKQNDIKFLRNKIQLYFPF
jgi:hypothetical protein